MNVFDRMVNNLQGFDEGRYFQNFIKANAEFITRQNKRRLYGYGTDTDGEKIVTYLARKQNIGYNYAFNTIKGTSEYQGKVDKAQPYDRVTISDTGAAYKTMKVNSKPDEFAVSMDDNKPDGKISDNLDLESALGLYDLQPLINLYTTNLRKEVLSLLRK